MDRDKVIIKTSITGILANLVLVAFKMTVGLISNSIAVILDAVNNLSDALSSIITIAGTKLAGKAPDRKHPYGYGRIEYITSVIIAVIVLIAGLTSLKESVTKIIHPEAANYSAVSLIIIASAVAVKFFLGRYVKAQGEKVSSQSLVASGTDALFDSILSLATLVAALINVLFGLTLEGWIGAVISAIIIKAGMEMLLEMLDNIIGSRVDSETTAELKAKVKAYPGVHGAYDVAIHNYGPNQMVGTVHIEVDDDMPASRIHALTQDIALDIFESMGILLTVGIYAANADDEKSNEMKAELYEIFKDHPAIIQMHGFYRNESHVTFDIVVDFKSDVDAIREDVLKRISEKHPQYIYSIVTDSYISDI